MTFYDEFSCTRSPLRQWEKCLNKTKYFLVDNGSLNPESTLSLRKVASELKRRTDLPIRPVGLMHSHKVDPSSLEGIPAESLDSLFESEEPSSWKKVVMVPFFFGPSRAITDWLPKKLELWKSKFPHAEYEILPCLHEEGDDSIAKALVQNTLSCIDRSTMQKPFVAMVDHGTPIKAVNQVREEIGLQMREMLGSVVHGFSTCCMERREGAEYDFNDPLLESLLSEVAENGCREVILAQLFLSPGRHAGKGGDLDEICSGFKGELIRTPLLGNHPEIISILERRIRSFQNTISTTMR